MSELLRIEVMKSGDWLSLNPLFRDKSLPASGSVTNPDTGYTFEFGGGKYGIGLGVNFARIPKLGGTQSSTRDMTSVHSEAYFIDFIRNLPYLDSLFTPTRKSEVVKGAVTTWVVDLKHADGATALKMTVMGKVHGVRFIYQALVNQISTKLAMSLRRDPYSPRGTSVVISDSRYKSTVYNEGNMMLGISPHHSDPYLSDLFLGGGRDTDHTLAVASVDETLALFKGDMIYRIASLDASSDRLYSTNPHLRLTGRDSCSFLV